MIPHGQLGIDNIRSRLHTAPLDVASLGRRVPDHCVPTLVGTPIVEAKPGIH
jgi:hypothetical protein